MIKKEKFETKELETYLAKEQEFIWFDTQRKDAENYFSYIFHNPAEHLECNSPSEFRFKLEQVDQILKQGYWLAGFINYEAGELLVDGYSSSLEEGTPLFSFGIYEKPIRFENLEENHSPKEFRVSKISTNINQEEYIQRLEKIKEWISAGEIYQVNFTMELNFLLEGSYLDFYLALRKQQNTSYSGFYHSKNNSILSLSPELFFKKVDKLIFSRPMKGTFVNVLSKKDADKNHAENFMIVDLLRNDLGKVCKLGSVEVKDKLKQETYQTLSQLTTKIEGIAKEYLQPSEILHALFPSGSVTGAPKKAAMEKIYSLENRKRGVYTGALGFFSPQRDGVFNVAIRTIELKNNQAKMGIGSGIVWDSVPEKEWEECLQKSLFLFKAVGFKVFETILSKNKKFYFLKAHLERLQKTCAFFQIPLIQANLERKIKEVEKKLFTEKMKWKLEVDLKGNITLEGNKLEENFKTGKISFSTIKMDSREIFRLYKTTHRHIYEEEYLKARTSNYLDVLFLNEKEEVTEGCITNVFIKVGNKYFTSSLSSGVLPGIMRNYLLKKFPKYFQEKVLYKEDLLQAEKIFICNSVRGIMRVELV